MKEGEYLNVHHVSLHHQGIHNTLMAAARCDAVRVRMSQHARDCM